MTDIIKLREELVERLRTEMYYVHNPYNKERLQTVALLHQAIQAVDFVANEGGPIEPPESDGLPIMIL